jgi:hypothetical protein
MTYIWHVTLNSGHGTKQFRADISDEALAVLAVTLDGILQGARMDVPGCPGYLISGTHSGHDLITTIWRGPWDERVPVMTMATALRSRSAPALWELMHDQATAPLATRRDKPPAAPWQADRIEAGALLYQDAMDWTGDFSRCLAWAWAEYRGSIVLRYCK